MSECIKTGARVLLQEYGLICAADMLSVRMNVMANL
jgi:3D (Asp-Asp-Asp) domain-containing protein